MGLGPKRNGIYLFVFCLQGNTVDNFHLLDKIFVFWKSWVGIVWLPPKIDCLKRQRKNQTRLWGCVKRPRFELSVHYKYEAVSSFDVIGECVVTWCVNRNSTLPRALEHEMNIDAILKRQFVSND